MKPKRLLDLLAPLLLLLAAARGAPASLAAETKPLMVYYMPWYSAKPFSDAWGWHWTMGHFDPETITASGERQIASW